MYPKLLELLKQANESFPVKHSEFRGKHSIIISDEGIASLHVWVQLKPEERVHLYYITLDEFDWDNIRDELEKARIEITKMLQEKLDRLKVE
jgi:hypothetical protein